MKNQITKDGVLVQITKAHADDDEICLSIVQDPGVHIRVSLTPENFVETLCNGRKVEARVVRWRIKDFQNLSEGIPPGTAGLAGDGNREQVRP